MKSTVTPPAIRKFITLGLIASLSAGVLLSGNATANTKPAARETAARSAKRLADKYPNLQRFARNLTKLARLGKLQMVKDYDVEIGHVMKTLADSTGTPVLIGGSNLDRSAIAQGLAVRIAAGDVPTLRDTQIFSLSLDAIAADAKSSDEFESRVRDIIGEAEKAQGQIVLFIDELQEFAGKRATFVASSTITAALKGKQLRVIGAASLEAYSEYIASDENLAGLFEMVIIAERDTASTSNSVDEQKMTSTAEAFEGDKISPDMREADAVHLVGWKRNRNPSS